MKMQQKQLVLKERASRKAYEVTEYWIEINGEMVIANREVIHEIKSGQTPCPKIRSAQDICKILNLPEGTF